MLTRDNDPEVFAHVEPIFHDAAFIRHLGIALEASGRGWCRTSIAIRPEHLQQVLRAGKTIIASESEVYAMTADRPVLVAKCMSTLAVIPQGQRIQR